LVVSRFNFKFFKPGFFFGGQGRLYFT